MTKRWSGCQNYTTHLYKTLYGHYYICVDCMKSGHMHIPDSPRPILVNIVGNLVKCQCEHVSH